MFRKSDLESMQRDGHTHVIIHKLIHPISPCIIDESITELPEVRQTLRNEIRSIDTILFNWYDPFYIEDLYDPGR